MIYAQCITYFLCLLISTTAECCGKENKELYNESTKTMNYQEPVRPYPYHEEDVRYENKAAGITLAGTLTMPQAKGQFPVALLISGMGPNDRDYTTCGHKLYLVLADYLTRHGIAVLRVDKRGIGASTGVYDTTATSKDYAGDMQAGIDYLKTRTDIDHNQIGLIGHSEGGMIAAMVGAQSPDVAFVVSMAGALLSDIESAVEQTGLQLKADGACDAMVAQDNALRKKILSIVTLEKNDALAQMAMNEVFRAYWAALPDELKAEAATLPFAFTEEKIEHMIPMFSSPWYRFFLPYQPVEALKQIKSPVLALNGDRDWITSVKTLQVIAKTLADAGNDNCTTIKLPNLNHQFRTCVTGSLAEYMAEGETMAPVVLSTIADWIVARTIKKES